jgi:hypothetical protein
VNRRGRAGRVAAVLALTIACGLLVPGPRAAEPVPPAGVALPPPRNTGPAAVANSRVWQHRRKTVRVIRRTPEVMREDAARVKRGDLFSTWSNRYLE